MDRSPPSCEMKKGSWTPEEDIILVSYIQQHGPGNWRFVPTSLQRCSKSCRLRWTNYLRPGIKRGNFTQRKDKLIIRLQALLGNRWAAIASYLPQRTDNDIKNYWNTCLKKKLKMKLRNSIIINEDNTNMSSCNSKTKKGQWEKKLQTDISMAKNALLQALSLNQPSSSILPSLDSPKLHSTTTYASSTENISNFLQNWKSSSSSRPTTSSLSNNLSSTTCEGGVSYHHSLFSSNLESRSVDEKLNLVSGTSKFQCENRPNLEFQAANTTTDDGQASLSLIENWLFDDQDLVQCDNNDQENLIDVLVDYTL